MLFAALSLSVLSVLPQVTSLTLPVGRRDGEPVAAAWFASWHASKGFPLERVNWSKYNTLIYSFAVTTPSVESLSVGGSDPSDITPLYNFVTTAHNHSVAAHVAIGGWTGSRWFSSNVATPENRTAFVRTVVDLVQNSGVDGVEFDWEFPAKQGVGCNVLSTDDTENFLSFLQELRRDPVGESLTLSAATSVLPFIDATGQPSADVSGFAGVFDYITIMNYDVWGSWSSSVGPNAPLKDTCADPPNQAGSAVSAVNAWSAAGMPPEKIVLGVPSYGHSFSVSPSDAFVGDSQTELAAYPKFDKSNQPQGDSWSDPGSVDVCGVQQGPGGTFEFWGLVENGFLDQTGNPAPGIDYRYDNCSQTPYVYDKASEVMISFDNADSFAAKGDFIRSAGLRGFAMWEAGGDYQDILLDSIRSSAGF